MKGGERLNFEQRDYEYVYKYLLALSEDEEIAKDLTQTTFLKAIQSINKYHGQCKLTTWLCGIAKNIWYQELEKRKKHKYVEIEDEKLIEDSSPEKQLISAENNMQIMRAIHKLNEEAKEVVLLRLFCDFSFAEIGIIMNRTETWCRVTFYRSKLKIQEDLDNEM